MISTYLSKKLSIISFFLIILVVLLHAQMLSLSSGVNKIIQTIITQEITRIAVPLFFSISGFLFFRNYKTPFNVFYIKKLNSRIRSILIPYLLTSIHALRNGGSLLLHLLTRQQRHQTYQ